MRILWTEITKSGGLDDWIRQIIRNIPKHLSRSTTGVGEKKLPPLMFLI
jgi:hypothetical protein